MLTEELARVSLALASSVGIHTDVVAPYLVELTDDEQKARWLPRFCTGELVSAIGMTEPSAGSDLAGLRTRARRNGAGWVVNGSKTFITNGASADLVVIAARTGEAAATSACSPSRRAPRASAADASSTRSASRRPTPASCSSRTSA